MKRIHNGIALLLILAMAATMTACSKHTPAVTSSSTSSELASSLDSSSTLGDLESSVSSQPSSSIASSSSTAASSSSAKAKSSSSVAGTKSGSTTTTTAPKGSGSTSHNTGNTGTKTGNTNVPAQKAQPAPTQKPSEPQKPNQPKTAYDRPFDATQIRNDIVAYGLSKGMKLDTSLWVKCDGSDYPSNAGYYFPLDTRKDATPGPQLAQYCKDDIDDMIIKLKLRDPNAKISSLHFNIVLLPFPNDPGNYFIFDLYS